ncbi:response regulator, partial [bacterium]|nr:response regulator [bacterium]
MSSDLQILHAGPDPAVASRLAAAISALGHKFTHRELASEAVELLGNAHFDMMLLDWEAGVDCSRLLDALHGSCPGLHIVALVPESDAITVLSAMRGGANDCLLMDERFETELAMCIGR